MYLTQWPRWEASLLLRALQWLSVLFWVKAKILTMLYKALHDVDCAPHPDLISRWSSCSPCFGHAGHHVSFLYSPGVLLPQSALAVPSAWNAFPTESTWIPSSFPSSLFSKLTFSVKRFLDTQVWSLPSSFAMSYPLSLLFFFFLQLLPLTYNIYYLDILFIDWIPQ